MPRTCRAVFAAPAKSALGVIGSRPASARWAKLPVQALYRLGLPADAQERAVVIGTFLQYLAGREHLAAHFLRGPGKEELGLDELALEEPGDGLVQPCNIALAARAHDDAS